MKQQGKLYVIGIDQMVLPMTQVLAKEGTIPTIAKLLERSTVTQALSSFPCYTINNWPVIATGAQTGTHGAVSWFIHMPDGEDVSSLTSIGINAEFMWDAAERQGLRSAVLHYPGSQPSNLKEGYIIDGNAGPIFGGCPFEIASAEAYTTDRKVESASLLEVKLEPALGWQNLPKSGPAPLATPLPVTAKEEVDCQTWQALFIGGPDGYDRVAICFENDYATRICESTLGQWSDWAYVPFGERTGTVRFKLTGLSADGTSLKLYRSQIMPTSGYSEPDEIGPELIEQLGPYLEHVSQTFDVMGIVDYDTCVEEAEYQGQWIAKAALYLAKEKGCDIFFTHYHWLDDVNHYHLAHVDPTWFLYDPEDAPNHWAKIRKAYVAIDHMMETLLAGVTEDDYVVMVADHGCSPINRMVYMERLLFDKGFLVFKDPKTPKTTLVRDWYDKLDWDKTKVWLHEGVFLDSFNLYINSKDPAEYKEIQRDLIRELRTWVDPKLNQTVFALVLAKRDAELIGLWGDQVGDVVVVLEANYQLGKAEGTSAVEDNLGLLASGHARMLPTEESIYGTQKAIFTVAGPGIKKGYNWPADKLGHVHLIDVAPTLCHALGIQPPAQSQGAIAWDIFEGQQMARERPNPTPYYKPTKEYKKWLERFFNERDVLAEEHLPC